MNISNFRSPDNEPLTIELLHSLADEAAKVYYEDYTFGANSLKSATSSRDEFEFSIIDALEIRNENFLVHECMHQGGSSLVGRLTKVLPTDILPDKAEEILCTLILNDLSISEINQKEVFFHHVNFPDGICREIIFSAIKSSKLNLFHKGSISILSGQRTFKNILVERITKQYLDNKSSKFSFLEAYRALEAMFLESILNELNEKFFQDPEKAVTNAKSSIEKERIQLGKLIYHQKQDQIARKFNSLIENNAQNGNSYCAALKSRRELDKSSVPIPDNSTWFGCWYIYQMRCSIAHAGANGIVYEAFEDSGQIIEDACLLVEAIIAGILGIEFNSDVFS